MDRFWQWAWDRHAPRYLWVVWLSASAASLPVYLAWAWIVLSVENSSRYGVAAMVAVVVALVMAAGGTFPSRWRFRGVDRWLSGQEIDRAKALEDTFIWTRTTDARSIVYVPVSMVVLLIVVGVIAGADGSRLIEYGILGVAAGISTALIGVHNSGEGALRPVRAALAGHSGIGDSLPRSRPTFAQWLGLSIVGSIFTFAVMSAMVAIAVVDRHKASPLVAVVIASALTLVIGVPITVVAILSPTFRPIQDLTDATNRVAAGDYSRRLPVVQDDDLGALAASFNRMQAGLAERQRLQAAFGTYVDPILAARLLDQGDDVFTGERREVTTMFIDIRDFTPYAEANTAEDTVARLNALFEIVVPAVVDAGGHVNKFLGDGALAVFGAPNDLADHADAALAVALLIQRTVAERFSGTLRIGIGINTGVVIAGTIGGGGKLEFTLIGDAVNVAARVEQLTKTTLDPILLTQQSVDALIARPAGLIERGSHVLKGKSAAIQVFGLDQHVAV
ncbi:adenylate/guanylate cyclase domain-containing protein [Mycobacterium sp. EPa45]|uniref:adenylate/guanylate cyclase domain-containing protein n=1 Tax=Mycobacterium sp. EPa45 TaxID=1545728 RepID=UPI0006422216|nr:adenylate/guanylate cyclase domain-containing protein [Mycobacterium sp. EPa45]AKK29659.1 cyclase [Mycobacterium sp. EPa45]